MGFAGGPSSRSRASHTARTEGIETAPFYIKDISTSAARATPPAPRALKRAAKTYHVGIVHRASHTARTEGIETLRRTSHHEAQPERASHTARTEGIETRNIEPVTVVFPPREPCHTLARASAPGGHW